MHACKHAGDASRASSPVTGGPATIGAYLPALLRAAGMTVLLSVLAFPLAVANTPSPNGRMRLVMTS